MAVNNSVNLKSTGVITLNSNGTFSGSTVTNGAVLLGGSSNLITDTGVLSKGTIIVGDGSGAPTLLSVGSNNSRLTADSAQASGVKWASAGSADSLEFVASATASASASLDFTGYMYSEWPHYLLVFTDLIPATDNVNFWLRTGTSSTYSTGASDYAYSVLSMVAGSSLTGANSTGSSRIELGALTGNASNEGVSGNVWINTVSSSQQKHIWFDTVGSNSVGYSYRTAGAGRRNSTSSIDSIQILCSSGNIASGTARLYRVNPY